MPYFAYNVGGWVQKEGKMCLCNKSMAPYYVWKYPLKSDVNSIEFSFKVAMKVLIMPKIHLTFYVCAFHFLSTYI